MRLSASSAPVIAAILLLLPLLYVGSFYLLARPHVRPDNYRIYDVPLLHYLEQESAYEVGWWLSTVYWPMMRMDKALRPDSWWPEYQS
jgi:hypothetical protein